jgi:phospholipid/cholesterol/gamma-HCH transport system substrate-binding protein
MKRINVKPLGQRSPVLIGVMGTVIVACVVFAAFEYDKLPFIKNTNDYSAYFSEAGGIKPGSMVRVSGMGVGRVSDVHLDGTKVRVGFTVRKGVELGDRTEAAIKTETVLGAKMLELTPRGEGRLTGTIALERTRSPYDLPDALGDLTTTISGLDTAQLSRR